MAALYGGWRVVDGSLETVWDASAFRRSARAGPGTRVALGAGAAVAGAGRSVEASSVTVEAAVDEALASDAYAALVRRRLVGLHVAAGCAVADAPAADAPAAGPAAAAARGAAAPPLAAAVVATAPGGVVRVSARTRVGVTLALRSAARDPARAPAPAPRAVEAPALTAVRELVAVPWLADLASDPERREIPEGALIHGPAGAGKTFACAAAAAPAAGPAFGAGRYPRVRAHELGCAGLLERDVGAALRALDGAFAGAAAFAAGPRPRAAAAAPAPPGAFYGVGLVVLDGVDAWGAKDGRRDAPALAAKKAVLCSRLRELARDARALARPGGERPLGPKTAGHVVVCGTSRLPPGDLDGAVFGPRGALEVAIAAEPPGEALRLAFLEAFLPAVEAGVDLAAFARDRVGYVAGDLRRLADAAARAAADRDRPELPPIAPAAPGGAVEIPVPAPREGPPPPASAADLAAAAAEVPPSGLAAFAVEVPRTSWADVGGQAEAKRALQQAVIWPVTRRAEFDRFGIRACRGVLLHGPPGCSKTLLARATASESSCAFIALSGADVYSPYLGEAEATVRRAFAAADAATPCILFFDEIDALVCDRAGGDGRGAEARVLSTFLNCLDGASGGPRDGVVTLGATNRPHAIDRALLRPGRLETSVYVGLPGLADREAVLAVHARGLPLAADVDLAALAARTRGFSGADLRKVCQDGARNALRKRPDVLAAARARGGDGAAAGDGRSPRAPAPAAAAPSGPPLSVAFADLAAAADAIVPSNDRSRTSPHAFASGWWADSGRKEPEPPGFPGARPNRDDVEVVDWRANLARRLADPATSLPPTPEEAKLTDPRPPRPPLGPDPGAADPAR